MTRRYRSPLFMLVAAMLLLAAGSPREAGAQVKKHAPKAASGTHHFVPNVVSPDITNLPATQRAKAGVATTFTCVVTQPNGFPVTLTPGILPSYVTFDNATTFTISPLAGNIGATNVIVIDVDDNNSPVVQETLTVHVNTPPTLASVAAQVVAEGSLLTVSLAGADADSDPLTYTLDSGAAGAVVNANTGVFSWTPSFTSAGSTTAMVSTSDGLESASTSFGITVSNTNQIPTIDPIIDQNVAEGSLLTVTPTGADADGDVLTWSGSNLPAGASVAPSTGVLTWTPGFSDAAVYSGVQIVAIDGNGGTASQSFAITVTNTNRAPVVDPIANQTVAEGILLTVTPTATDPDGDVITWGVSNLPAGASVNATTGQFNWTPTFTDAGTYTAVTLIAQDGLLTGSAAFNITVTNTNRVPTLDSIGAQTVPELGTLVVTPVAADADSEALTFSVSNLPSFGSVNASTGVITFTPGCSDAGLDAGIVLTVSDGTDQASRAFDLTVTETNNPPVLASIANQSVAEGALLTITPSASDPNGDVLTWGATNLPAGATQNPADGVVSWTPGFTQAGNFPNVAITVSDGNCGTIASTFAITVTNTNQAPVVAAISNVTANEGDLITVTPSGSDPDGDVLTWTGSSLPGTASVNASTGVLSWQTISGDAGSYPGVTLTASDGTLTGSASFSITVNAVVTNHAPVIAAISNATMSEGQKLRVALSATDSDGDNVAFTLVSITPTPVSPSRPVVTDSTSLNDGTLTWKPLYNDGPVTYTLVVQAADSLGASSSTSFTVLVNNNGTAASPPAIALQADTTIAEGVASSIALAAEDNNAGTLAWQATVSPAGSGLTLLGTTGTTNALQGTPSGSAAGSYSAQIVVRNTTDARADTMSFGITITNVNQPPAFTNLPATTSTLAGGTSTYTITTSDVDGDVVAVTMGTAPAWITFNAGTNAVTLSPTNSDVSAVVTFSANDGQGHTITADLTANVNHAPIVAAIPDQSVAEGALLTVTPSGSDSDGDVLAWSGTSLPSGSAVNATTGVFTWTPSFTQAGNYPGVTLVATDTHAAAGSASFAINVTNVNGAPVVAPISNVTANEGDLITVTPSGSDPDGDVLTWSGSSLPGTATVSPVTGVLTWQTISGDAGTFAGVTLTASDGSLTGSASFSITVNAVGVNHAPVFTVITNKTLSEGQTLVTALNANDVDATDDLHFTLISILNGINPPPAPGPVVADSTSLHDGKLSWTPMYNTGTQTYTVKLRVADPTGATDSTSFTVTVNNNATPGSPPVIALQADTTIAELAASVIRVVGSDNNTVNTLTWGATITPPAAWLTLQTTTGTNTALIGTPPSSAAGIYNVRLILNEATAPTGRDTMFFNVTVTNVNAPPVLATILPQVGPENSLITFTATATDPDGDPTTFSVSGNPAGSSITSGGVFTWTPDFNAAERVAGGNYGGTNVVVSDGQGGTDSQLVPLQVTNVNQAPVVSPISNATIPEGALFTFAATATDPDTLSSITSWSRTGQATGATIDSAGVYSWTPDFTQGGSSYSETVTATDNAAGTGSASFTLTVTDTNRAPSVAAIANVTANAGDLITVTPTGTDPDGDVLTWSGSSLPGTATVNATSGVFTWQTLSGDAGTYAGVTLTASDGSLSGSASFSITVNPVAVNNPPVVAAISDQTVAEGALLTVTPSGTDADGDVLTWSGSSLPSGATVNATSGILSWTPDFTQAGSYPGVTLTANDGNGGTGSASFTIVVTNSNRGPVVAAIADQTVAEGVLLTVTPSATDADGDVLAWSGSNLPSGSVVDASSGVFTWTPSFSQAGVYPNVVIKADDGNGGQGTASFTITVTNSNVAPVVAAIPNQAVTEGSVLTVTPSGSDADGDVLTWSGSNLPAGAVVNAVTGVFVWTPGSAAAETNGGVYAGVTLVASDGTLSGSASFTITVSDQAPVITTTSTSFCAGGTTMQTLAATDDDGGSTTWSMTGEPSWLTLNGATGVLTGSPAISDFGFVGAISVTATDAASGAASTASVSVAVDCTPVQLVNAVTSSEPFNRHRLASSAYTVKFAVEGDVRPDQIVASNVALQFGGARIVASTVQVVADQIVAGFDRGALAGLLADLASGETAHLALIVSAGDLAASTQLDIAVTGLHAAAAAFVVQNPVHGAARVQYTAPEDGLVDVAIYNANGRLVQTLLHEVTTAGRYEMIWNSRDAAGQSVPSGVYYLRATMAGERVTSRLLMVR